MHSVALLFINVCFVGWIAAFDIDKTQLTVNIKGSEITVSVPDDRELISVFFSTEFNDECTFGYTFFQNFNNSSSLAYKQDIKKELKNDDEIRILGVFQTTDQVIRKNYDFKIDDQGNLVKQEILENLTEECKCIQSQTEVHFKNVQKCSDTLLFEENFNENLSNWKHELRSRVGGSFLTREFVAYVKDKDNCFLDNGSLHIKASWVYGNYKKFPKLEECTSQTNADKFKYECGPYSENAQVALPAVYSAKLHTKDSFRFKYGRVEIRAKLPIGDWLFPYLILQPVNSKCDDDNVNHIRIGYTRGNKFLHDKNINQIGGNTLFGSVVLWRDGRNFTEYTQQMPGLPEQHYGDAFHNYTMIWRKDRIIFKVDGFNYGEITNRDVLNEINKNECFFVLGLTAGGAVNFPDSVLDSQKFYKNHDAKNSFIFSENTNLKKTWSNPELVIDYIRVYTTHGNEE
ncbi:gram-negative bacteria-binding protein 2-like [Drosophila innubila]|uniref:gram-negative bacteria-binding protein 2-like n=1 Tax=Drosophila innubila TaxID=198719 RepID=UPI00148DC922|nr:gram-negative bacteria-binding protein 2-like [Drosophila innubila]